MKESELEQIELLERTIPLVKEQMHLLFSQYDETFKEKLGVLVMATLTSMIFEVCDMTHKPTVAMRLFVNNFDTVLRAWEALNE